MIKSSRQKLTCMLFATEIISNGDISSNQASRPSRRISEDVAISTRPDCRSSPAPAVTCHRPWLERGLHYTHTFDPKAPAENSRSTAAVSPPLPPVRGRGRDASGHFVDVHGGRISAQACEATGRLKGIPCAQGTHGLRVRSHHARGGCPRAACGASQAARFASASRIIVATMPF